MKNKKLFSLLFGTLFGLLSLITPSAHTQPRERRPELSGEFELEEDSDSRSSYSITQDRAIQYFKNLEASLKTLSESGNAEIPEIDDNMLLYISGVYLYCIVNQGVCLAPLDALLETDVISARLKHNSECPNLTRFWKLWVRNDMERRHEFLVKTGFMAQSDQFKREKRPRYIKCQQTVTDEVKSLQANPEFFKARYSEGSPNTKAVHSMVSILEAIKAKVGNVFTATGTTVVGAGASDVQAEGLKEKKGAGTGGFNKPSVKKSAH